MLIPKPKKAAPPPKPRAERQRELQALSRTERGRDRLAWVYRLRCGAPEDAPLPRLPVLILRILAREYPTG